MAVNATELDYYGILNVPRCAKKEEITLAYRKLAIRLNPNRDPKYDRDFVPLADPKAPTHMSPLSKQRQWDYINMAYDILGNDLRRNIYDRFGEAGLVQGAALPNGYFPPYVYHGNHLEVYHSVFGTYSPYANLIDVLTNPPILYNTPEHGCGVRTKDPPVKKTIPLDLEEIRFGSVKLMQVWRMDYTDAEKTRLEKKRITLTLNVAPGTTEGTTYRFREQGDRHPTKIPADIVFVAVDKPHPCFKRRNGHDLVYEYEIDLCKALTGFQFFVKTLDQRTLTINISDVVYPGFEKVLPNEGLPKCIDRGSMPVVEPRLDPRNMEFGNLIIVFKIRFPKYLNKEMKKNARTFFSQLREMEESALNNPAPLAQFMSNATKPKKG